MWHVGYTAWVELHALAGTDSLLREASHFARRGTLPDATLELWDSSDGYAAWNIRSFGKGLADRGGWREEILERPEIQASFLYLLPYSPLGEGEHTSGDILGALLGGFACRQPPPANPFSKPLKTQIFLLGWHPGKQSAPQRVLPECF